MKRLILVRHGETIWNAEKRLQGQIDTPLSETGIRQADQATAALAGEPCDVVYTSDLIRAADTAARIAAPHGLTPILDERLRQSHRGAWQGLTEMEIQAQYPDGYAASLREPLFVPPGGESHPHYAARLRDFFAHLERAHPAQTVIVVSHGLISRMLICLALKLELSQGRLFTVGNAAWADIGFEAGRGRMKQMNTQCHLQAYPAAAPHMSTGS